MKNNMFFNWCCRYLVTLIFSIIGMLIMIFGSSYFILNKEEFIKIVKLLYANHSWSISLLFFFNVISVCLAFFEYFNFSGKTWKKIIIFLFASSLLLFGIANATIGLGYFLGDKYELLYSLTVKNIKTQLYIVNITNIISGLFLTAYSLNKFFKYTKNQINVPCRNIK
jgi:hypothetical protein